VLSYRWFSSAGTGRTEEKVVATPVRTLAVLPFTMIGSQSEEYIGLGIADALITRLSGVQRIIVRPTSAVLKYSSQEQDPRVAGREQRVDTVLEGKIQRSGERVRVSVQLLSTNTGASLWADSFDENFTDVFAVQDAICQKVAQALVLQLSMEDRARLAKDYTENKEAYELYLKGRYFANKLTPDDLNRAVDYFQRAIEKDPAYALAYGPEWRKENNHGSKLTQTRDGIYQRSDRAGLWISWTDAHGRRRYRKTEAQNITQPIIALAASTGCEGLRS